MARVKVFMRIAKTGATRGPGYRVAAHTDHARDWPLSSGAGINERKLPTLAFALILDVPDAAFEQAEQVIAEIRIPEKDLEICAEVTEIEA